MPAENDALKGSRTTSCALNALGSTRAALDVASAQIFANPEVRRVRGSAVPLRRLGTCEDVAEVILWLASDAAAYVTGQNLAIDGGLINTVIANLPRT